MEFWKKLFKDKDGKTFYNLLFMLTVGIVLLVAGSTLFKSVPAAESNAVEAHYEANHVVTTAASYEQQLEKRLEDTLSLIAGAGKVKVMLTLRSGKETVAARNEDVTESVSSEKDNEGGSRETQNKSQNDTFVMVRQKDGSEVPLILKEIEPQVEGVVIVAEGGDNIVVKDALIRAAYTALGVPSHRVQVAKMRG